jgi:hypothetical protein
MKWAKLGKIFDPAEHRLPNNCFQFAQSPQALVCDNFVRIYFSTREIDSQNKPLSHIAYADFAKDLRTIIGVSQSTVIELGQLGCFDEHGIFPMNVVRHDGKVYGYTCGWSRRVSVAVETSIGLAVSDDNGRTFQKIGNGPVMTSSLKEPFLVGDPFVTIQDGLFHMWYIFGTKWKRFAVDQAPDRVYKIGHAVSHDGIRWDKEDGRQIVSDRLNTDESQALPTVIKIAGRWHMFFCYRQSFDFRHNRDRSYRLGYAYSDNVRDWVRDDPSVGIDVSADSWDSDMLCYPHVFACDGNIYLLYNGNEFGRHGFGIAILQFS